MTSQRWLRGLQRDLDDLERTDPDVAAAALSYDAAVDRLLALASSPHWCRASKPSTETEPRTRCVLIEGHGGRHLHQEWSSGGTRFWEATA